MTAPITVLVVDDQPLVRDGIASLLATQEGIAIAGVAGDGAEALDLVDAGLRPDVALVDVRMPGIDGIAAARGIRDRSPNTSVVMLTTFDDADAVDRSIAAGVRGYLLKSLPAAQLAASIRLAHAGVAAFDGGIVERLRSPDSGGVEALAPLTPREREVLRLLGRGASNREIAATLYVSVGTVKNHVSAVLAGLGVRDRTQAALIARAHGL